jgi:hypothetical protein
MDKKEKEKLAEQVKQLTTKFLDFGEKLGEIIENFIDDFIDDNEPKEKKKNDSPK